MKRLLASMLKYFIAKVKKSKYVQRAFNAPIDLGKFEKMGQFTDSLQNSYVLYRGLRSRIKPGWESMVATKPKKSSPVDLKNLKNAGSEKVNRILPVIKALGKSLDQCTVLEVGCHSGSASFALSEAGANKVTGSEFLGYKVESVELGSENNEMRLNEVDDKLSTLRNQLAGQFTQSKNVDFAEDDICNTKLPKNAYDIICSWEVLEHLHDPGKAFQNCYDLLKDDGIMIHRYNPFFSLNGGHSLCTLDFLWGHTRLSDSDFEKYLDEIRPDEKEKALSFYRKGLNRMTLHDLTKHLNAADLELVSIIPFTNQQHLLTVTEDVLIQSKMHYPDADILDFIAPLVLVAVRKSKNLQQEELS
jgi:2-polyprenyl-3-methyl-5-hydroxy-6-metoxy-1,4-benzoquinol methylase